VSSTEQAGQKEAVTAPATPTPESGEQQTPASAGEQKEQAAGPGQGLKPVYFDFDKSFIRDDAREVLKENAAWLKAHPKVKIKIEGNCDEKGTKEYNQALGQRRAVSAKKYLADMGVSDSRISLISYGKEKPVCTEGTENCWQKNRRDDFVVND
jgi:peptidoglycan-associated lipoprotein